MRKRLLNQGLPGLLGIVLFALTTFLSTAHAGDSVKSATQAQAAQSFAIVTRIAGQVTATPQEPTPPRLLKPGDLVYVGEKIHAAAGGEALLKTHDAGYIAVRSRGSFVVDDFAADRKDTDRMAIRMIQGGLRLITGWVGKLNPQGQRLITPTATIGIRGTDHEPYLVSAELAVDMAQPAGVYDKVNSGGTTLESGGASVDIDPGKVGFSRLPGPANTRALMTLVLPVLLEKVPAFYVPGAFDAELDIVSGLRTSSAVKLPNGECNGEGVSRNWLKRLDAAIARKQPAVVAGLFAPDVKIEATVFDRDGKTTTITLQRSEFVASTIAALKSLTDYQQNRLTISGTSSTADACKVVQVQSLVVEQGKQKGLPYRFESLETYELLLRNGRWVAVKALTTQQ